MILMSDKVAQEPKTTILEDASREPSAKTSKRAPKTIDTKKGRERQNQPSQRDISEVDTAASPTPAASNGIPQLSELTDEQLQQVSLQVAEEMRAAEQDPSYGQKRNMKPKKQPFVSVTSPYQPTSASDIAVDSIGVLTRHSDNEESDGGVDVDNASRTTARVIASKRLVHFTDLKQRRPVVKAHKKWKPEVKWNGDTTPRYHHLSLNGKGQQIIKDATQGHLLSSNVQDLPTTREEERKPKSAMRRGSKPAKARGRGARPMLNSRVDERGLHTKGGMVDPTFTPSLKRLFDLGFSPDRDKQDEDSNGGRRGQRAGGRQRRRATGKSVSFALKDRERHPRHDRLTKTHRGNRGKTHNRKSKNTADDEYVRKSNDQISRDKQWQHQLRTPSKHSVNRGRLDEGQDDTHVMAGERLFGGEEKNSGEMQRTGPERESGAQAKRRAKKSKKAVVEVFRGANQPSHALSRKQHTLLLWIQGLGVDPTQPNPSPYTSTHQKQSSTKQSADNIAKRFSDGLLLCELVAAVELRLGGGRKELARQLADSNNGEGRHHSVSLEGVCLRPRTTGAITQNINIALKVLRRRSNENGNMAPRHLWGAEKIRSGDTKVIWELLADMHSDYVRTARQQPHMEVEFERELRHGHHSHKRYNGNSKSKKRWKREGDGLLHPSSTKNAGSSPLARSPIKVDKSGHVSRQNSRKIAWDATHKRTSKMEMGGSNIPYQRSLDNLRASRSSGYVHFSFFNGDHYILYSA